MSPASMPDRPGPRARLARGVIGVERAVDARISRRLRQRPEWSLTVVPYIGHGTTTRAHVRARVVLQRQGATRSGPLAALLTNLAHYLTAEVAGESVTVEMAGQVVRVVADQEGYADATLDLPGLSAGWHPVTFRLDGQARGVEGRVLVVDPAARIGVVSDIDDTIIHTGLTRLVEAVRTSLFVAEEARVPIAGAAELYQALVQNDAGRAPVFYVSTGAWNLHAVLERFLSRHNFPTGPLLMTDWGPGWSWLFREGSMIFKSRVITALIDEHPQLRWVLVGDSGQHDPEAYAAVIRARPDRVHAAYIREAPPQLPTRTARVHELAAEARSVGVPMVLLRDSVVAAEHARGLGLLDPQQLDVIREAVARAG